MTVRPRTQSSLSVAIFLWSSKEPRVVDGRRTYNDIKACSDRYSLSKDELSLYSQNYDRMSLWKNIEVGSLSLERTLVFSLCWTLILFLCSNLCKFVLFRMCWWMWNCSVLQQYLYWDKAVTAKPGGVLWRRSSSRTRVCWAWLVKLEILF